MNLGVQEVGVALFILDHPLEQVLSAGVAGFAADLCRRVVLAHGIGFVGIIKFQLLLDGGAHLGRQGDVDGRRPAEENDALDQSFGMVHFLDGPRLGKAGQPAIAPALAHFRLYHVLRNGRQLRAKGRIQLLDDFFVTSHLHTPSTSKGSSYSTGNSARCVTAKRDEECRPYCDIRYSISRSICDIWIGEMPPFCNALLSRGSSVLFSLAHSAMRALAASSDCLYTSMACDGAVRSPLSTTRSAEARPLFAASSPIIEGPLPFSIFAIDACSSETCLSNSG